MLKVSHCLVYLTFTVIACLLCRVLAEYLCHTTVNVFRRLFRPFTYSLSIPCLLLSPFPFFFTDRPLQHSHRQPEQFNKVQHIVSYLDTDTVLFQSSVSNHPV